ncbi:hypothetical protein [Candidatus Avelusimicrobium aviculae]|uniref:hypothetical protein n=1 Tax=Candidatus Avelusimicrobium aviculae TaxID=3416206 RepID=UPI003D0ED535
MKKILLLALVLSTCAFLNAEPTYPNVKQPETKLPEVDSLSRKIQAQADKFDALRKVPVVVSAKGLEPVHAFGVLLRVNSNYTQADILLDEDASRAVDIVGEGDYEGTAAPVSVYIDLSAFGKGFFSDNKNANRDFYASHEEKQAPLYVYRMKVNPKGNFAKSIKGLHPVSEHAARQML